MSLDARIQNANMVNISNALAVSEYYDWLVRMFVPYLGERVLEIGAGIGTFSERLARYVSTLVVTDIDVECLKIIRPKLEELNEDCRIEYTPFKLGDRCPRYFKENLFDSVLVLNVLEHVEDDVSALSNLKEILKQEAKLIVFVPAMEGIYGTLDKALGHFRRYRHITLAKTLNQAGYTIVKMNYVNVLGILGWWLNACVLKRTVIPVSNFRYFRLLFPLVKIIESKVSLPFGISLLAVAMKR